MTEKHFSTSGGDPPSSQPVASPAAATQTTLGNFSQGVMFNVIIPLSLLAGSVAFVVLLGTKDVEQRPDPDATLTGRLKSLPPVVVEKLESLDSLERRLELEVDGVVVPFQEARVAAEVAGRVVFKDPICEAGSYVTAGQLLMRIDDKDYQFEVDRLSRLVEQEEQSIKELDQESLNSGKLKDIALKDVELQEAEVNRLVALSQQGAASRGEVDQANRALLAARQQLVTVENQYDLLKERRVRLDASKRLAETQLSAAKLNLERTEIKAPIDGVIVSEEADLNTFVSRGSAMVTIENTSKVEVASSLRMDQLYWVLDQVGREVDPDAQGYDLPKTPVYVEYVLNGREDTVYRWKGWLLSYDGIGLDPETRTVPVRVLVDQPRQYVSELGEPIEVQSAPALLRGMYVRVRMMLKPRTQLVVIPARALQPGNRVLQFLPDPSVLDVDTDDASSTNETASVDKEADGAVSQVDDRSTAFDPQQWEAGRVVTRKSIYPVEILANHGTGSENRSSLDTVEKYWICEVADPELTGGSFVVVSPMAEIKENEATPARADVGEKDTPSGDARAMSPKETVMPGLPSAQPTSSAGDA